MTTQLGAAAPGLGTMESEHSKEKLFSIDAVISL